MRLCARLTPRCWWTEPGVGAVHGPGSLLSTRETAAGRVTLSSRAVATLTQRPGIPGPHGHARTRPCLGNWVLHTYAPGTPLENTCVHRTHTGEGPGSTCPGHIPRAPRRPPEDPLSWDRRDQSKIPARLLRTQRLCSRAPPSTNITNVSGCPGG